MSILTYFNILKRFDWLLLIPVLLLILLGLSTLYASTLNVENPNWTAFLKQLTFFGIGLGLLLLGSFIDYRLWRPYVPIFYVMALLLAGAVLFFGATIRGTTGWFNFWGFTFQPIELTKFCLPVALSFLYAKRINQETSPLTILLLAAMTLMPVGLSLLQPDFGAAAVMIATGLGYFALLSMRRRHALYLLIGGVIMVVALWNFVLIDYQKDRVLTFIKPMSDPLGTGYNVRQSIIAVGSGQLLGRGLGLGTQSQLKFLPETKNDFIFAMIAETLGFVGSSLVIILFAIFYLRLLWLMREARDNYSMYLVFGIGLIFFIQTIVNIGMNIGLLPVVGLSLPFLSYGGSFLTIAMLAVGVIESVRLRQKIV